MDAKTKGKLKTNQSKYTEIHMPKSTSMGFVIAGFSFIFGFAMVWHIWWAAALGLIGVIGSMIRRSCDYDIDYYVKAEEIETIENQYHKMQQVQA